MRIGRKSAEVEVFDDGVPLLFCLVPQNLDGIAFPFVRVWDGLVDDHGPHELTRVWHVIEAEEMAEFVSDDFAVLSCIQGIFVEVSLNVDGAGDFDLVPESVPSVLFFEFDETEGIVPGSGDFIDELDLDVGGAGIVDELDGAIAFERGAPGGEGSSEAFAGGLVWSGELGINGNFDSAFIEHTVQKGEGELMVTLLVSFTGFVQGFDRTFVNFGGELDGLGGLFGIPSA